MNEFKPLTLHDKQVRMETKIADLEDKRSPLVNRKREIELELSELTNQIRGNYLPRDEYKKCCDRQDFLKREKLGIERQITGLNDEKRKLSVEKEQLRSLMKRQPDGTARERLTDLKIKYLAFASDRSRISSMRAMAAEFAQEIETILTALPD